MLCTIACTDGATRVAYDIESGVEKLGPQDGARTEISHAPKSWPEGCDGSYRLRLSKGRAVSEGLGDFHLAEDSGGLAFDCASPRGYTHGYGTTYHLRFVDVPKTLEVVKTHNETAVIEVERQAGRAVVVGLR